MGQKVVMISSFIVLCVIAILLLGCSPPVVRARPPEPRAEVHGPPPFPEAIWIPGHWAYRGGEWFWIRGDWARPPRPHARWIPSYWEPKGEGWVWREGHWEYW